MEHTTSRFTGADQPPHFRIRQLTFALRIALYLGTSASLLTSNQAQALTCPVISPTSITTDDSNTGGCIIEDSGGVDITTGSLTNVTGAQLNNLGSLITQSTGNLDNQAGASLNNTGILSNNAGGYTVETRTNGTYGVLSGNNFTNSGTLSNQFNGALINETNGLLINNGNLSNLGTIDNFGGNRVVSQRCPIQKIEPYSYGVYSSSYFACEMSTSSGVINNDSFFNQSGSHFTNHAGALLENNGTLSNSGAMVNAAGNVVVTQECISSISRSWRGYATYSQGPCAWDMNEGIRNHGTLINEASGTLNNAVNAILGNYYTVLNDGILNNSGHLNNEGIIINEAGGHLVNEATGRINNGRNTATYGVETQYLTLHVDGTVINNGIVDNHGTINLIAGTLTNNSILNNSATGKIISQANHQNALADVNKHIVNNGTMNNAGQASDIFNNGTLNNSGIIREVTASEASVLTNSGNITTLKTYAMSNNTGTLDKVVMYSGASLTNIGTINALTMKAGSAMSNSGTLSFKGTFTEVSGSLTNTNYLLSEGSLRTHTGYYGYSSTYPKPNFLHVRSGSIYNQGRMVIKNNNTLDVSGTGQIVNDASIEVAGSDIRIDAQASITGSGTITLQEGYSDIFRDTFGSRLQVLGNFSQHALQLGDRSAIYGTGTITTTNGASISVNTLSKINPGEFELIEYFDNFTYSHPYDKIGTLSFGSDLTLAGELIIEITGLDTFDILQIFGNINFDVGSKVTFDFSDYLASTGDQFDFLKADSVSGIENLSYSFVGLDIGGSVNLITSETQYLQLFIGDPAAVPLPASLWLFGSGLLGLAGIYRNSKKRLN